MSDLEYFFLDGKPADVQRHVFYWVCLADHLKTDPRFRALIYRLVPKAVLVRLHAEATSEVIAAKAASLPVAYGKDGVEAPVGGAIERYLDAWHNPKRAQIINKAMTAFVREELKLEWAWLPHELERLLYFLMLAKMGIIVDIENELWVAAGQKTGPGRYQRPNSETVKRHVEWFYRNKIKGETMAIIAAEVHKEETTVRDAIHGVERVLRVSPTLL